MSSKNKLRRLAGELITVYLKHPSFKAHEGSFMPLVVG